MANMKDKLKTPRSRDSKANLKSINSKIISKVKFNNSNNTKRLRSSRFQTLESKNSIKGQSETRLFNSFEKSIRSQSNNIKLIDNRIGSDVGQTWMKLRKNSESSLNLIRNISFQQKVTDANKSGCNSNGLNNKKRKTIERSSIQKELQDCTNKLKKLLPESSNRSLRSQKKSICLNTLGRNDTLKNSGRNIFEVEKSVHSFDIKKQDTRIKYNSNLRRSNVLVDARSVQKNQNVTINNIQYGKGNVSNNIIVPKKVGETSKYNKSTAVATEKTMLMHIANRRQSFQNIERLMGTSTINTTFNNNTIASGLPMKKRRERVRRHFCEICFKAFFEKSDLNKHRLIHTDIRPFPCSHCNKSFRQAGNLKTHILCRHSTIVDTEDIYVCDYCSKPFIVKERLRLHLRTHMGQKPYTCQDCGMKFARKGEVRQHIRKHTGERNYECRECSTYFSCKAKLILHLKSHMGIREFTCYLCGKSFLRPDAIKKHLTCYHFNEKPFECPVCKKKLKGHLREHMRTHLNVRPHICKICKLQFTQRSHLTVHERTHSGDRPYKCRVCWRSFAHSTALTLHTRRHTGEKPIQCPICPAAFAQLPHMKKHMLNIHNESLPYKCKKCQMFFRTKFEVDSHIIKCLSESKQKPRSIEEELSEHVSAAHAGVEPPMPLSRMRLLLAILLKKISSEKHLEVLGFNKRLIDDILIESLESSGHTPCKDQSFEPAVRLKINVQMLLDWTVPKDFKEKFRSENKSTEELLEQLTS